MATETLSEEERMRRVPGIIFADGPVGRRARVAGSGIDVWEVINEHRICGNDRNATAQALDSLTSDQIQAAFDYYAAFPKEIDERLRREAEITPEYLRAHFPQPDSSRSELKLTDPGTGSRSTVAGRAAGTLGAMSTLQVAVPERTPVLGYLAEHPGLCQPLLILGKVARAGLPADVQLSLELYRDRESDDQYLSLYARQKQYTPDLLDQIDAITDKLGDELRDTSGWVQLTTDFRSPE